MKKKKFNLQQLYWKEQLFLLTTYKKWCPLCMDTGWIRHYRKILSGRGYVLNWELQKASQLAKRNKKYITKATFKLWWLLHPRISKEQCMKRKGHAAGRKAVCSAPGLPPPARGCWATCTGWRKEREDRTSFTFTFMAHESWKYAETMTEWTVEWPPPSGSICCRCHNYPLLLYVAVSSNCPFTPSLASFRKQESRNCISWKQKRGAPWGVQVQREFSGRSRGRMTRRACSLLTPGTLVRSQEQRGHCTHPTASGLGGFVPVFHQKEFLSS